MELLAKWGRRKPWERLEVGVSEKNGVRAMHLGSRTVQSAMRLSAPFELELDYTRAMMGFLLFAAPPGRIVACGLGGGSLVKFIYHKMPEARVTAVEINPRVAAAAQAHFFLPQEDARFSLVIADAGSWMQEQRAIADVLLVDGYDQESQVEALSSAAFYANAERALGPAGVLVVNLWGTDRKFDHYLRDMESIFPGGVVCLPAGQTGNIIAFAFKKSPGRPRWNDLKERARLLEARYGLEYVQFVGSLKRLNPHNEHRLLV